MKTNEKYHIKSKGGEKIKIVFSSIGLVLTVLFELFFILNFEKFYEAIAGIAFLIVIIMYILVSSILNEKEKLDNERSKQFEDLFKSEKASYLLIRKNYQEIGEKLLEIEKRISSPNDEVIETQKSLTKLILKKNIDNTKALSREIENSMQDINSKINSLLTKDDDYRPTIENIKDSVITKIELLMNENNKELYSQLLLINKDFSAKQQQIITQTEILLEKENNIINSVYGLGNSLDEINIKKLSENKVDVKISEDISKDESIISDLPSEDSIMEVHQELIEVSTVDQFEEEKVNNLEDKKNDQIENGISEIPGESVDIEFSVPDIDETTKVELETEKIEDLDIEKFIINEQDEVIKKSSFEEVKPMVEEESLPTLEVNEDPNKQLSADEIAAMFASVNVESDVKKDIVLEDVEEKVVESIEEVPVSEVSKDPNKQLSADEISAMFASVNADNNVEEPMLEEIKEKEKSEEIPVIEVSGDPNKQLSADEIAALFASVK